MEDRWQKAASRIARTTGARQIIFPHVDEKAGFCLLVYYPLPGGAEANGDGGNGSDPPPTPPGGGG